MRKYIIIPCILSIFGHGLFFTVFKTDIKSKLHCPGTQLYLITEEQFDYLASAKRTKDIMISPYPVSLSCKNTIWKDSLDIVRDIDIMNLDIEAKDDSELLDDSKKYNFQEIPSGYYADLSRDLSEDFVPVFSDLFHSGLLPEKIRQNGENILKLNNDINMRYYIQGPVQPRGLVIKDISVAQFNMDKSDIKAKFRLWITKDGRVNQVIVEESSSFPLVDSEIVNLIKTWCFNPVYDPKASDYEWGVVRIRMQR